MASLKDRLLGIGDKLNKAFLGVEVADNSSATQQYPDNINEYINGLGNESYMQGLLNQPKEVAIPLEQIQKGVAQGLNFGIPQIAAKQRELGISIPKTEQEIEDARNGMFNNYSVTGLNMKRQGGLLPDIAEGFRENYNNPFRVNNIGENQGWGRRIGEGLGTVGRFIDSPAGRGLITAGLIGAVGGNPAQMLGYGLSAGVGRQNYQTADKIYRQQLKQMGYTDDDLNNIRGNVTPEIYKGLTDSFRLGNQRMTYGQLATFDDSVKEFLQQNPEYANQFVPVTFAKDVYGKKNDLAGTKITNINADTNLKKAKTEDIKNPKARVNISIKKGGTTSNVNFNNNGGGASSNWNPPKKSQSGKVYSF